MNMKKVNTLIKWAMLAIMGVMFYSCPGPVEKPIETPGDGDTNNTHIIQVGNEYFSIPSPVETAFLVRKSGVSYKADLVNPHSKVGNYATKVQKSLNLGIYGADLAYVNIYEQKDDAVPLLKSASTLASELGVNTFNKNMVDRFEKNIGNKDSLLVMVADAYQATDAYLKKTESTDIGSLILAGGWIEALYFSTSVLKEKAGDEELKRRIGEQKHSLKNLIKLLQIHFNNEEYADLVEELSELYDLFEDVKITYEYIEPQTDVEKKLTTIKSKSEVDITQEQVDQISEKVKHIRNSIVG